MPKFSVSLPPSVLDEMEAYVDFIAEDSVIEALKWYQGIKDAIYTLDENPKRCPIAFEDRFYDYEIRNMIFGNYRVLYRIQESTVQILHVRHGAQERKPFDE